MLKKVFKVTIGTSHKNCESTNVDSRTVIATDVWDALGKAGDWILKEEKRMKKDKEEMWVESVECITIIDIN